MAMERKGNQGTGAIVVGSAALVAFIAALIATKPAKAAEPDEKIDYLVDCQTALVEASARMVLALEAMAAAQGVPIEGVTEVSVTTPWVAKDKEQIFDRDVRETGTLNADRMVEWTRGKRLILKIESSLDQGVLIQPVGNIDNNMNLASNIDGPIPCAANGNISIGFAWDDWHPWIGARIIIGVAPTTGHLNIWAVIQE